jgi:O-antigen ligase
MLDRGARLLGAADPKLDRARAAALAIGCALLFWQYDGAAVDWFFGAIVVMSAAMLLQRRVAFELSWPHPLVLAFLAVTVAATLLARGSFIALAITVYLVLASLAFASILRAHPELTRWVRIGIVIAATLTLLFVVVGWLGRHFGVEPLYWLTYDGFRSRGLFKDPNVAGGFLAVSYPIVAAYVIRRSKLRLPLLLLVTIAIAAGVAMSFSRMALVVFALGVLGVMIALPLIGQRRLFAGFLAAFVVAGLVAGGVAFRIGLSELPLWRYQLQAYDEAGRFVVWGYAGDMFRDAPLGTGAGSFEPRAEAYFNAEIARENASVDTANVTVTTSAHNTYLRVLVESGIIGFLAFMAFIVSLLVIAIRSLARDNWEWPLAFVLVLVAGLAIDTLHWRELWVLAAVIGGSSVAVRRGSRQRAVATAPTSSTGSPAPS